MRILQLVFSLCLLLDLLSLFLLLDFLSPFLLLDFLSLFHPLDFLSLPFWGRLKKKFRGGGASEASDADESPVRILQLVFSLCLLLDFLSLTLLLDFLSLFHLLDFLSLPFWGRLKKSFEEAERAKRATPTRARCGFYS